MFYNNSALYNLWIVKRRRLVSAHYCIDDKTTEYVHLFGTKD